MSLAALFLNGAYVALVGSAYTRTLSRLRILLIIGSALFIAFGAIEEIWPMVGWNILIIASHLVRVIGERRAQKSVVLTADECAFRDELFPSLSDYDFNLLWSMGQPVSFDSNEVIIADGSCPGAVSVVTDGTVAIDKSGEAKLELRRGALLGDMSYISGKPASVDVTARGAVAVRQWDERQLLSLDQAHPASSRAFRDLVGRDLANKAHVALG